MAQKAKAQDSTAVAEARVELVTIVAELQAIKARLGATAKRLRAAESTAAVVEVDTDGKALTVEGWTADLIGDETPEVLDDLLQRIGQAADPKEVRASIRHYLETERRLETRIAARRAAGK